MSDRDSKRPGYSLDEIEEMESRELEEAAKKEKKSKFNIFNRLSKDGKGVEKDEIDISDDPKLINFFKLVGRKINQLLTVNLYYIFFNFPVFFLLISSTGYFSTHVSAPVYTVFGPLNGIMQYSESRAAVSALWSVFAKRQNINLRSPIDYIFLGLGLLLIITYGPVRVGLTYLLRNMFRGEPVFMWHDFKYAIKRNIKQALIYGVLDVLIIFLLGYDLFFFNINYNVSMMMSIMFFMSLFLAVLYLLMRQYIYLMLVTFELSIPKMFKNGLYFSVLGIKRNLMYLLGTAIMVLIEIFFMHVYVPIAVIIPFILMPSINMIMGVYAAYPKIKEIMIDPYYEKNDVIPEDDNAKNTEATE